MSPWTTRSSRVSCGSRCGGRPVADETRFPCPCCGYLEFGEPPGSYDSCEICF
ncbi:CPCC family cysteine-rich protein [Actinoplanes sp. NPDC051470]|uniref:CPCC family cysteine-rich protein n=1 Tax=unclassified Actinoplanes TaxID=2626549 RepID=UPI003432DFFA